MRLKLPQKCVYWAPIGADSFGRPTFASPVQKICRWEDKIAETIDADGNEVLSNATVYLSDDVLVGGALFNGAMQDLGSSFPPNIKNDRRVREIISKGRVPNLKGTQFLTSAMLK